MRKKIIGAIVLLLTSASSRAGDYDYLTVCQADGTVVSLPSLGLSISFTGETMLLSPEGEDPKSFPLSNLSLLRWSSTDETSDDNSASAIESAATDELEQGPVTVYTAGGALVGTYDNLSAAQQQLRRGIYLVKGNGRTLKIVRK